MRDKLVVDKKLLEKQFFGINISLQECTKIGIRHNYSVDEFVKFETLCSRYSRGMDFLVRRVFGTLFFNPTCGLGRILALE